MIFENDAEGNPLCPVCKEKMKSDTSYMDYGTICECVEECPNGCYRYDFSYGGYVEAIGNRVWIWSYTTDNEEVDKIGKEIKDCLIKAREDHG